MTAKKEIPFGLPMIGEAERKAVAEVLAGTQLVHGPKAAEFERLFAARLDIAHAISVSSCTAGLHLALHIHGVGPGDEVIVPAMTHVATAHAVEYQRAKPVFADIDPQTGNIDPKQVAALKNGATRSVTAVHYLGLPVDMDAIQTAVGPDVLLVEDCALALDASYKGRKAGRLGDLACFSFYPVKHLTTAEGGMVTTDNDKIAERIRNMKAFGYDRMLGERKVPGVYDVVNLGYNYRMSELHAAIGVAQMARLDEFRARRRANFDLLRSLLSDLDEVFIPVSPGADFDSAYYCLNAILPRDGSVPRAAVLEDLKSNGIGFSVHYPAAIPQFAYYREKYNYCPGMFPNAEWYGSQAISLPVGPHLSGDDVQTIAAALKQAIVRAKKQ